MNISLTDFYIRLAVIVILIAVGFFLARKKFISDHTASDLVNLLLFVFMPMALLTAFPTEYTDAGFSFFTSGLLAGVITNLALIIIARLVFSRLIYRGNSERRGTAQFAFIFNNATFLGYPIVISTFGPEGVLAYCGFIIAFNITLFSYGVWLFTRKIDKNLIKSVVTNPNIIAILVAALLFVLNLQIPAPIRLAASYLGGATVPLSLIYIGYMLSRAKFLTLLKKWHLVFAALAQLILGPLATYGLLTILGFPREVILVCTLLQALPTATSLALFAQKYGRRNRPDEDHPGKHSEPEPENLEASELVSLSTVLSCATLPLIILLLFR